MRGSFLDGSRRSQLLAWKPDIGTLLAGFLAVKILDARFHPRSRRSEGSLVLARVYCERDSIQVEPVHSAFDNTAPMQRLRWLVEQAGPHAYESLLSLHSDHWTFAVCRAAR